MVISNPLPRLCLLGGFRLLVGGRQAALPLQVQRVLALLAVHRSAQARSMLAGILWGDVPERRAQANLRNAVWRLKLTSDSVLQCTRDSLGLGPSVSVDLHEARHFAHGLLNGDLTGLDERSVDGLGHDLLPSWDEEWLLFEQERQRQLRMHALEALSVSLCGLGRYPEAITSALAAVRAEPLRESAQRTLICAHLGEGNFSEALRQLDSYRELLGNELGLAPSDRLAALVRQPAPTRVQSVDA